MTPFRIKTVHAPNGLVSFEEAIYEEHHMGACTVSFFPDKFIEGARTFFTTGGCAEFTSDSAWLVIHDWTLVVAIDLNTGRPYHYEVPTETTSIGPLVLRRRPRFITTLTVNRQSLCMAYETGFHTSAESKALTLGANDDWRPGLGPAKNGIFPSAYKPDVERILVNLIN